MEGRRARRPPAAREGLGRWGTSTRPLLSGQHSVWVLPHPGAGPLAPGLLAPGLQHARWGEHGPSASAGGPSCSGPGLQSRLLVQLQPGLQATDPDLGPLRRLEKQEQGPTPTDPVGAASQPRKRILPLLPWRDLPLDLTPEKQSSAWLLFYKG